MLLPSLLLAALVLHQATGEDTAAEMAKEQKSSTAISAVEGKDLGGGYGYSNNGGYGGNSGYGRSYNRGYGGYGNGGYGGYSGDHYGNHHGHHTGHYNGGHHQEHKLVPIKLPYLDKNGCRFAGDVVCDDNADPNGFFLCIMDGEAKNLWKKPTFAVAAIACPVLTVNGVAATQTTVLNDFCNDNKRLLKAAGLIQQKDHTNNKYFHQGMFAVSLNPCILA